MSKSYPRFFIELIGEPGDVNAVADTLEDRASTIDEASFDAITMPVSYLGMGPTFDRARSATMDLANLVDQIAGSLRDSAGTLRDWAGTIEEFRGEFDRVHAEQDQLYTELAVDEPRLNHLRVKGDLSDAEQQEFYYLWGKVGDLKRSITANHQWAQDKLEEYENKAEDAGTSLQSDSISSPAASAGDRRARTFLGISDGLGKIVDIAGLSGLLLAGVGSLVTKAGSRAVREAIDELNDGLAKSLMAGSGAKLGADTVAAANGAGISPGELVFNTLNLNGIGPLDKLKGEALERIDSEIGRELAGQVVGKVEDRLTEASFGEHQPPTVRP